MISAFLKTYGCQDNVADSDGFRGYLNMLGADLVETAEEADLILVNTCAVREKAEQKLYSYIGELLEFKQKKPYLKIGILGCVASYRAKEMLVRFDHVSFSFGARKSPKILNEYFKIIVPEIEKLKEQYANGEKLHHPGRQDRDIEEFIEKHKNDNLAWKPATPIRSPKELLSSRNISKEVLRSFVKITSGCNNYCSYCIVPFTRGQETSHPMTSIVKKITEDIANGVKEITLVGQNVNSYTDPETGGRFPELLEAVAQIKGEFWTRFVSPHPKDVNRQMVEVMAKYKDKLCSWIHFPLQSGSTKILELMKRTYTQSEYLEKVKMIRTILPDVFLSSDIIVGFPGETNEDYLETRDVMEKVSFSIVYSFIYSPRRYTPAATMGDPCPLAVKQDRLEKLQLHAKETAFKENSRLVGKIERVLVEKKMPDGRLVAKSTGNVRVFFEGLDELIGTFVNVRVLEASRSSVVGVLKPAESCCSV
jgi:tRNA-2-methylthio-N6-dimethylallyladenosine synthase